jgi:hypothetical protein
VCTVFGVALAAVGLGALFGMRAAVNTPQKLEAVQKIEATIIEHDIASGALDPEKARHKMVEPPSADGQQASARRE